MTTIVSLLCLAALAAEPDTRSFESLYLNASSERWSTAATVTEPAEALQLKTPATRLSQSVEFGIGDDALWIEFSESPATFRELSWLEIRKPHLDYLTVFFETNNGEVKQLGQVQGDDLPFYTTKYIAPSLCFFTSRSSIRYYETLATGKFNDRSVGTDLLE